jgi:hypothetical protein
LLKAQVTFIALLFESDAISGNVAPVPVFARPLQKIRCAFFRPESRALNDSVNVKI